MLCAAGKKTTNHKYFTPKKKGKTNKYTFNCACNTCPFCSERNKRGPVMFSVLISSDDTAADG